MRLEDSTNNEKQRSHTEGGDEEGIPTTKSFDEEEHEDGSCNDFDDTVDTRSEQGVRVAGVSNLLEVTSLS
jgi:hypothetical protein